jgi:phage shock protein PspC (stress-responsive transcriptional regulator)
MNDIRAAFARQGLVRSEDRAILGGVCAGVGRRLGLTPWTTRLLFLLVLMVLPGSQLLVYPVLWILMPSESSVYAAPGAPRPPS